MTGPAIRLPQGRERAVAEAWPGPVSGWSALFLVVR